MMKVLVTGADGFIGSHLVEHLLDSGYQVSAFVCYNSFNSYGWLDSLPAAKLAQINVISGDIRDPHAVRQALQNQDAVAHLAALIAIPYSYQAPDAYLDTNVRGTLNVLQAAREVGCQVIQTSTSEVYGTAQYVPIDELHPLVGQSPYAATKIAADQLALSFYYSFGVPVKVIRPFNTYGPRQSARAVIPTIIGQLAAGSRRLLLGALHPTRDFSFVADTVAGFEHALRCDAATGQVINLGSGFEISIADTAQLIAEVMGYEVDIMLDPQRLRPAASEVERLFADHRKAQTVLGWQPAYAGRDGFKRGLAQTADWFCQPDNLARYRVTTYTV